MYIKKARLFFVKWKKIFFVSVSHQRSAGSNTLPILQERIFVLFLQKITKYNGNSDIRRIKGSFYKFLRKIKAYVFKA